MPSANLAEAVATGIRARTINNGQSCIAAKRFIVASAIYDEFERRFVEGIKALRVGDPLEETTEIGPLATAQILKELDDQVTRSVAAGASLLTGARKLDRPGNFYDPAVLTNIPDNSPAACEELFGPVALAWTNDEEERMRFIDELDAGCVFINAMVASDPRLPFGGVKTSGYGRELGEFGIREFVNIKTVWIA